MSSNSAIEWTTHTFNPWWGCTKVHDGCKHCYAEATDARWGGDHWGPRASRRMILGEWGKPAKWDAEARAAGRIDRVFCASMCDIFEDFDGPVVDQQDRPVPMRDQVGNWTVPRLRRRALEMVRDTPNLDWLLLSKRPENAVRMCTEVWGEPDRWPRNVMFGTSPCNQATADECIPALLRVPGRRFLSCEPLLGAVDLTNIRLANGGRLHATGGTVTFADPPAGYCGPSLDWVIVGGESGGKARPFNVEWARSIVTQCKAAGVPVFYKQGGSSNRCEHDSKGGCFGCFPPDLQVREFPIGPSPC